MPSTDLQGQLHSCAQAHIIKNNKNQPFFLKKERNLNMDWILKEKPTEVNDSKIIVASIHWVWL